MIGGTERKKPLKATWKFYIDQKYLQFEKSFQK